MNMRKFYFLPLIAGTLFAYTSCSNDLVEEISEELSEHVQTGTPMNFSAQMGGEANINEHQSGKRKLTYNEEVYIGNSETKGTVNLMWEVGDKIGVDCPDAYDVKNAVYRVTGEETWGDFGSYGTLEKTDASPLKWGEKDAHRVFCGYPAGKVIMGNLTEGELPELFSRDCTLTIDKEQNGNVEATKIRKGQACIDGYRVIDRTNMISGGVQVFYKSETDQNDEIFLPFDTYFTAFDVIFTNSADQGLTIKKVKIVAENGEGNEIEALSGKATGTLAMGGGGFLEIQSIAPTMGESHSEVSINVKGINGEGTFELQKDNSLSVVLCALPMVLKERPDGKEDADDEVFGYNFKGTLTVTYNYSGEGEQTKSLDISSLYWANSRNRIVVPALPHVTFPE